MADIKEVLDGVEKRAAVGRTSGGTTQQLLRTARFDVPALVAALRAVLDMHGRRPCKDCTDEEACPGICVKCGSLYPCADIRAITEALVKSDG